MDFRFPGTKEAQSAVKFSTPTDIQAGLQLPPEEDLFGSISAIGIHDASSTGESSGSLNAAVLMDDETSKDLGFGDSIVGDSRCKFNLIATKVVSKNIKANW